MNLPNFCPILKMESGIINIHFFVGEIHYAETMFSLNSSFCLVFFMFINYLFAYLSFPSCLTFFKSGRGGGNCEGTSFFSYRLLWYHDGRLEWGTNFCLMFDDCVQHFICKK